MSSTIEIEQTATGGFESEARLAETIASYDATAPQYAVQFKDADMGAYLERFVQALPVTNATVLDAGCGSGRDCRKLESRGLAVVGVDLSRGLLKEARAACSCPLVQGDLRDLPLAPGSIDGVWSCASLVHLPPNDLPRALGQFRAVLRRGGVLFVSTRHGRGGEWRPDGLGGRRYFHFHEQVALERELVRNGFVIDSAAAEPGVAIGRWVNIFARVASR